MFAQPVQNYTPQFPFVKPAPIRESEDLVVIRDQVPFTQENLSSVNALRFFLANPATRDDIKRNYQNQPYKGHKYKRPLAIGFVFNNVIIEQDANHDPRQIVNAMRHTSVIYKTDDGSTKQLEHHGGFYTGRGYRSTSAAFDDGTNAGSTVAMYAGGPFLVRVPDDQDLVVPGTGETFELEMHFDDTTAIPAAADTDLEVQAFISLAIPKSNVAYP
jgi:hypothetical protein